MPDLDRKRRLDRERIAAKRAAIREERRRNPPVLPDWIAKLPDIRDIAPDAMTTEELFEAIERERAKVVNRAGRVR